MNTAPKRLSGLAIAVLFLHAADARAGLIELIETESGGQITLSIEGNALRLTDNAGGTNPLRVQSTPGSGATTADDLGFAGDWPAMTVVGAPLQDEVLLPSTRLDSLLDSVGISSSGNILKDISIIDSASNTHVIDIDAVEVIGGSAPEPGTFTFLSFCSLSLLNRRIPGRGCAQAA